MSTDENKAIIHRYFAEAWNRGDLSVLDEIVSPKYMNHNQAIPGLPPGPEGLKPIFAAFRQAFPDLQYTVEDQIAQGDIVVTRWTLHGTHLGEFMGIPATAKPVNVTGIQVERIIDRKITEHWRQSDDLGLMYQLGVLPGPGQS
jgi:steroid delta-isomerase-like uncharacterized protein